MKIKKNTTCGFLVLTALAVSSCSTPLYQSSKFDLQNPPTSGSDDYGSHEGLAYFLPKGYVHIVADLQIPVATAKPAAPGAASDSHSSTNEAAGDTQLSTNGATGYKVSVDVLLEPDPAQMYLIQPQTSVWAHDTYGISIQNGLLSNIGSTNVDQTGGVFVNLSELAGLAVTAFGAQIGASNMPSSSLPPHIELTVDPDSNDYSDIQQQLNQTAHLSLKIAPLVMPVQSVEETTPPLDADKKSMGVFYRPLLPYKVTITDQNNNNAQYQSVVLLPNHGPILSLDPKRASMVTAKNTIIFDHGCPTGFSFDRESSALAWSSLPLNMIKAFLSAPAEIVQLKLNFATTNAQLSTQELTELNNQLSILKQEAAIQQYQLTNGISKH